MSEMRVMHLYTSWTAGGAEKRMIDLAFSLEEKGIKNFIGAPKDSYIFKQAQKLGIKANHLIIKGSFDPFGIFRLYDIVRKENINILHAHQGKVFWPCILMKWFNGDIKVVFHRRTQLAHAVYSRTHYNYADKIIAISNAVAEGLIKREGVPKDKVSVIYNSLNTKTFDDNISEDEVKELKRKYNLENKLVVGTVAAINKPKGKGHQYLIEAAEKLHDKYPQLRFLVVGTGPLEDHFRKLAQEKGLKDTVVFTGYQEDVEKHIAAMDVFCLLSWDNEGFGQVVVEAQALGKPVIGTNVGGIPETFKNGETGMLINKEDTKDLVRALEVLLSSEKKREEMGAAGIKFVKDRFNNEAMIERMIKTYNELFIRK
ncbi:MAG: glycosyltransferase [Endomicrobiales bacterium]|nr:glycosyltransferase [Endomicrobiales bacterium]